MSRERVRVKISGSHRAVKKLLRILEQVFPLLVAGPIIQNDRDEGCHLFLNVDPFLAGIEKGS